MKKEKKKIHINKVKNTANIEIRSMCCDVEIDISGGGYEGEYIYPIIMRCPKCGKIEPKTYNFDTESGKKISYQGIKVPF